MNMLEKEYEDLETRLGSVISGMLIDCCRFRPQALGSLQTYSFFVDVNRLLLLSSGLQLRSFYFIASLPVDYRRNGLLKAFTTAIQLITAVDTAHGTFKLLDYSPFFIPRILTIAATILLKVVNSSYSMLVDQAAGKQAFNCCLRLLRRASVEDNDLPGKASRVMAQLWGVHRSLVAERIAEPSLKLKSRLGASVLHDSLWTCTYHSRFRLFYKGLSSFLRHVCS